MIPESSSVGLGNFIFSCKQKNGQVAILARIIYGLHLLNLLLGEFERKNAPRFTLNQR